jgi:cytochrome P450 family 6
MGVVIFLLIGAFTALYFFIRGKLSYWKNLGIAHDEPSLLLGNLDGVGQTVHLSTKIQVIYEKHKIGNKLCGFYLLQSPRLIIIDPELIKNIIVKDFNNFADRGIYHDPKNDVLSAHLFALEGKIFQVEI